MLRKGVYSHECMDESEKINETIWPEEEDFYNILNMANNADADCMHAKRFCENFERKHLGENYNLYVKIEYFWLIFSKICKAGWGKNNQSFN